MHLGLTFGLPVEKIQTTSFSAWKLLGKKVAIWKLRRHLVFLSFMFWLRTVPYVPVLFFLFDNLTLLNVMSYSGYFQMVIYEHKDKMHMIVCIA